MAAHSPNISAPHLSPGFSQRVPVSSSPVVSHSSSPPRTSTTPNPPRPPSATQHQAHAQPSPNLPHVTATRQNPAPGMYFPSLHGVQFTQEQMEHAMRLQLMVSGGFHLHYKPGASAAMTPYNYAGLRSSGASTAAPSPGIGSATGSGSSSGAGAGTGRNTGRIIRASALKVARFILRIYTVSRRKLHLWSVPTLYIALSFVPPYGPPCHRFTYMISIIQVSHISYNGRLLSMLSNS